MTLGHAVVNVDTGSLSSLGSGTEGYVADFYTDGATLLGSCTIEADGAGSGQITQPHGTVANSCTVAFGSAYSMSAGDTINVSVNPQNGEANSALGSVAAGS
jgi:hypothetical protein